MLLLLLLLCFFGHVTNVKAQENLKIYRCWGKLHFVLGLLARDIPNHSYVQNTPLTQALNLSSFFKTDCSPN